MVIVVGLTVGGGAAIVGPPSPLEIGMYGMTDVLG